MLGPVRRLEPLRRKGGDRDRRRQQQVPFLEEAVDALDVVQLPAADRQKFGDAPALGLRHRSEEHTSELQSLMRISYAVFCLKKKNKQNTMIETIREQTYT